MHSGVLWGTVCSLRHQDVLHEDYTKSPELYSQSSDLQTIYYTYMPTWYFHIWLLVWVRCRIQLKWLSLMLRSLAGPTCLHIIVCPLHMRILTCAVRDTWTHYETSPPFPVPSRLLVCPCPQHLAMTVKGRRMMWLCLTTVGLRLWGRVLPIMVSLRLLLFVVVVLWGSSVLSPHIILVLLLILLPVLLWVMHVSGRIAGIVLVSTILILPRNWSWNVDTYTYNRCASANSLRYGIPYKQDGLLCNIFTSCIMTIRWYFGWYELVVMYYANFLPFGSVIVTLYLQPTVLYS